ncbi:unnamed protein product [Zymoseptoria tritici ST99CH_3D1]|nr:unnamed protein product [Zymoseptoria tritici ST99CH_3D1]
MVHSIVRRPTELPREQHRSQNFFAFGSGTGDEAPRPYHVFGKAQTGTNTNLPTTYHGRRRLSTDASRLLRSLPSSTMPPPSLSNRPTITSTRKLLPLLAFVKLHLSAPPKTSLSTGENITPSSTTSGAFNRVQPSTANAMIPSITNQAAPPRVFDQLEMIHASLIRGTTLAPTYNFSTAGQPILSTGPLAPLYSRGGVVIRITAETGLQHDVMLCDTNLCLICSRRGIGSENPGPSQFNGLPFCHVEDVRSDVPREMLRPGRPGEEVDYVAVRGATSPSVEVRCEMEEAVVQFQAGRRDVIVRALVCVEGKCEMCFGRGPDPQSS